MHYFPEYVDLSRFMRRSPQVVRGMKYYYIFYVYAYLALPAMNDIHSGLVYVPTTELSSISKTYNEQRHACTEQSMVMETLISDSCNTHASRNRSFNFNRNYFSEYWEKA